MNILITGGTGLLGMGLLKTASSKYNLIPTFSSNAPKGDFSKYSFNQLDITKKRDVSAFFKEYKPEVVIHAASIGNVDYCEKHPKEAYAVNVKGTENIVSACITHNAKLVFTSSNAVFDGTKAPYSEKSKTSPLNYYGKTKVIAEEIVKNAKIDSVIIRLILMYGWNYSTQRDNSVTWLLKKLVNKEKVKLVDDTYTNPIYNLEAAKAIWKIIDLKKKGIYHLAGSDRVNRYEFGVKTAKVFGLEHKYIEAVPGDYFAGIAKRMPDTTYDTTKMQNDLLIKPLSLIKGLRLMKNMNDQYE